MIEDWDHPRSIVHLTSENLRTWRDARPVTLAAERPIDAAVVRLPQGGWRLYNNELDQKSIWYADSPDLESWTDRGKLIRDQAGEGPRHSPGVASGGSSRMYGTGWPSIAPLTDSRGRGSKAICWRHRAAAPMTACKGGMRTW